MSRKWSDIILGILALGVVIGLVLQSGIFQGKPVEYREEIFAMDTVMSFTAYGKNAEEAVKKVSSRIRELENLYSAEKEQSEVSRLNQAGELTVSREVAELFRVSREVWESTGGAFDCTIYPLMKLWGFPEQKFRVPSGAEIAETLPLVDSSKIAADGENIRLGEGQEVDFGGVGKGFASAEAMEVFRQAGVKSALVSLGGNIQVLGAKPDGSDWKIGIRDPETGKSKLMIRVKDCCVITSGGYERFFEAEGRTYIHILDPKTGEPVDNELASVTVVSEDGARADALSTALFVMGYEKGSAWWQEHAEECQLIWIMENGSVVLTEGLSDRFENLSADEITVLKRN